MHHGVRATARPIDLFPATLRRIALRGTALGLCLVGLAVGIVYYPTLAWLVWTWWDTNAYSHGFLIPLISLFLAWEARGRLAQLAPQPALWGGSTLLAISAALLLAGRFGGLMLFEAISLIVLLPGLVVLIWGWRHLRVLALPLAYLQFTIPWMDPIIDRVHWPFQLLSARLGTAMLNALQYPAFRDGIHISLPGVEMEVAPECSGVRFLTTVIAIGIPLTYFTQRSWRRAAGVIASGVAFTILTNSLRVALAGLSGYYGGSAMLHGPYHVFHGWFVAQFGLVGVIALNWIVGKADRSAAPTLRDRPASRPGTPTSVAARDARLPVTSALLVLLAVGAVVYLLPIPRPTPLTQPLPGLAQVIEGWRAVDTRPAGMSRFFPGADAELTRTYRSPSGQEVQLYVAYFESQHHGKTLVNWQDGGLWNEARPVAIASEAARTWTANYSHPVIEGRRHAALFWYRLPSGEKAGRLETRLRAIGDALFRWRNGGAVVLIAAAESGGEAGKELSPELPAFARAAAPALRAYLP